MHDFSIPALKDNSLIFLKNRPISSIWLFTANALFGFVVVVQQPPLALRASTSARLSALRSIAARMRLCLSRESG